MAIARVLVLRTAGTNCDREMVFAFKLVGAQVDLVHFNALVDNPRQLQEYQILVIPGGFSYGDDIAAGKILAVQLRHHLPDQLAQFIQADKLVLGVCNGFQVLVKAGLLPWPRLNGSFAQQVTLTDNDSGKFEDRWVYLQPHSDKCAFVSGSDRIYLPIAHGEGKFVTSDKQLIDKLEAAGQVVFKYVDAQGHSAPYPANPNGSEADIAAVCDPTGRIMGIMPHPERFVMPTQHPHWTRLKDPAEPPGLQIFQNALRYFH